MRCLYFIVLLLTIKVNSVPISEVVEKQQLVMVNKREVGAELGNIKNSILKESEVAYELSNASISTYLKDLYVNSISLRGRTLSHLPGDHKVTATQTIRSYKNQAKSKLHVKYTINHQVKKTITHR